MVAHPPLHQLHLRQVRNHGLRRDSMPHRVSNIEIKVTHLRNQEPTGYRKVPK